MSDIIDKAVRKLAAKLPDGFDGSAKFVIEGEGAVIIDETGVRPDDGGGGEVEVTLTAGEDVFRALLSGELDPTAAFMSGRLRIDGAMGKAMKLGAALG